MFWNADEGRLRAPWRILLQGIFFVVSLLVLSFPLAPIFVEHAQESSYRQMAGQIMSDPLPGMLLTATGLIAALAATFTAAKFIDHRPLANLGLQMDDDWWADAGFGLGLGVLTIALVFIAQLAAGWITVTGFGPAVGGISGFGSNLLAAAAIFASIGIYEELLSRGYQLTNLAEGLRCSLWGRRGAIILAVVITSAVFGVLHAANPSPSPFALVNVSLTGLLIFGPAYILTGRLGLPMGFHISWNFAQSFIFGLPVSGLQLGEYPLLIVRQAGPELWTGGTFGPEGGILGTLAIFLASTAIFVWVKARSGQVQINSDLAEPPEVEQKHRPADGYLS